MEEALQGLENATQMVTSSDIAAIPTTSLTVQACTSSPHEKWIESK